MAEECLSVLGGRVVDLYSNTDEVCDLYIKSGRIVSLGKKPRAWKADLDFDAKGLLAAWFDKGGETTSPSEEFIALCKELNLKIPGYVVAEYQLSPCTVV